MKYEEIRKNEFEKDLKELLKCLTKIENNYDLFSFVDKMKSLLNDNSLMADIFSDKLYKDIENLKEKVLHIVKKIQ